MISRFIKSGLRITAGSAARIILSRLAPRLPALRGEEWPACQFSFSQFGEDRILVQLLEHVAPAAQIYVDVGAHHPAMFSNTLLLYKNGWRGINIDANHDTIRTFDRLRPSDKNIWAAASDVEKEVLYHCYPQAATNHISPPGMRVPRNALGETPNASVRMLARPLNTILSEQLRPMEEIGLLNIDCEGEDLTLLKAFDWIRWRPFVIAVESRRDQGISDFIELLSGQGYEMVSRAGITLIFRRNLGLREP